MKFTRLKYFLTALAVFCMLTWVGTGVGKYVKRDEQNLKAKWIQELESEKPDILLVGNSMLDSRIHPETFESLVGNETAMFAHGGSASAIWYLFLKNVFDEIESKPPTVVLFFRDNFLTDPTFRVDGIYRHAIIQFSNSDESLLQELSYGEQWFQTPERIVQFNNDREAFKDAMTNRVQHYSTVPLHTSIHSSAETSMNRLFRDENLIPEIVNQRQLEAESVSEDTFENFDIQLTSSYLPAIIDLVQKNNSQLILVRVKRRRDLTPEQQPEELLSYLQDLGAYLDERKVMLIDYTQDNRIKAEHYSSGDHLSEESGKPLFTEIFASDLKSMLKSD